MFPLVLRQGYAHSRCIPHAYWEVRGPSGGSVPPAEWMEKKSRVGWDLLPPFLLFRSTQVDRKLHRLLGAAAQAGLERPWHPAKLAAKERSPGDPSSQPLFPAALVVLNLEQAVPAYSSRRATVSQCCGPLTPEA